MIALLDTGFLYALFDAADAQHRAVVASLDDLAAQLLLPDIVIVELAYLLNIRLGHQTMRSCLERLQHGPIEIVHLLPIDIDRSIELLHVYADIHLDFVDAGLVAMAERLQICHILTTDRRDFQIIRPKHCQFFSLIP